MLKPITPTPTTTLLNAITDYLNSIPEDSDLLDDNGLLGISTIHRNTNSDNNFYLTYLALEELEKKGNLEIVTKLSPLPEPLPPQQRQSLGLSSEVAFFTEVYVKHLNLAPPDKEPCRPRSFLWL